MRNRKVAARRLLTNSLVHAVVGALGQGMLGAVQELEEQRQKRPGSLDKTGQGAEIGDSARLAGHARARHGCGAPTFPLQGPTVTQLVAKPR